jgi:hypothetical protein
MNESKASAGKSRQKDMADNRQKLCARVVARAWREATMHATKQSKSSPSWVNSETAKVQAVAEWVAMTATWTRNSRIARTRILREPGTLRVSPPRGRNREHAHCQWGCASTSILCVCSGLRHGEPRRRVVVCRTRFQSETQRLKWHGCGRGSRFGVCGGRTPLHRDLVPGIVGG